MLLHSPGWRQEVAATEPLLTLKGKTKGKLQKGKLKKRMFDTLHKTQGGHRGLYRMLLGKAHLHINSLDQELPKCCLTKK